MFFIIIDFLNDFGLHKLTGYDSELQNFGVSRIPDYGPEPLG